MSVFNTETSNLYEFDSKTSNFDVFNSKISNLRIFYAKVQIYAYFPFAYNKIVE